MPNKPRRQGTPLSKREREVLLKLSQGFTVVAAAEALGIAPSTVGAHKKSILQKMGAHSITEAVGLGLREGIIK